MMKQIFLLGFLVTGFSFLSPFSFAQGTTKRQTKSKANSSSKPATVKNAADTVAIPEFVINGTVTGYPEGTTVELLNGQTGATEMSTLLKNNSFQFKGKMERPEFKIILFTRQPPYITVFLDNSVVTVIGDKANIDKAKVTGSASHTAFEQFNSSLEPYQSVFAEAGEYDSAKTANAMNLIEAFVSTHTDSYITPLAIIRYNQIADDIIKTETLYNQVNENIKVSAMGQYIAKQIEEGKLNGAGTVLSDFSQPDTSGVPVSLSSLRGQYVLVDFWASWCAPCRQENPNLVAAYHKYKDKKFTVLGVSLDKAKESWIEAIKMDGLTWTHISDLQGWQNSVSNQFKIFSIPQNFLVDPDGKVIGKNLRGAALDRKLAKILR